MEEPVRVIRDFETSDYVNIYEVEGAAYQYWRLTALLRSLGKGSSISIDENGDWIYLTDEKLDSLLVAIDERTASQDTFSSLLGVWADEDFLFADNGSADKVQSDEKHGGVNALNRLFFPIYNLNRSEIDISHFSSALGKSTAAVFNFLPCYMNLGRFFETHDFMREQFVKRRGYDFEIFLSVLSALSSFFILPEKLLYLHDKEEQDRIRFSVFVQTLTRGYQTFKCSRSAFCKMLQGRIEILSGRRFETEELLAVLESLSLTEKLQSEISPWSGGPHAVLIPGEHSQIVDLVGILSFLQKLFVFMPDKIGNSGTVFEQLFREALGRRGHDVASGELFALDQNVRELDAGVVVGSCLYLFECVSIERPLNYEIGDPRTINIRIERLEEKLKQASTLKDFIASHPVGKNFDYSGIVKIEYFVVSPFVEWIWTDDSELWTESGRPRIVSPSEAFSMLETAG